MSVAESRIAGTPCSSGTSGTSGAADIHHLLQEVLRVSREWMAQLPVLDPQRNDVFRLALMTESLLNTNDLSSPAINNARGLLCGTCRRLNAAFGRCAGQALDHCQLLKRQFDEYQPPVKSGDEHATQERHNEESHRQWRQAA